MIGRLVRGWVIAAMAGAGFSQALASSSELPIYIEDSHAGSFYFLAEHLDLDRPHTFLLFDAHSDASAIFNSDAIRAAIRSANGLPTKEALFQGWRESGKIQCYNWIEPLMPRPLAQVIWVPPYTLQPAQIFHLENECRLFLDGHEEVCPRLEKNLSHSYSVTDLNRLKVQLSALDRPEQPIVVSIDLDFFANTQDTDLEQRFKEIFLLVLTIKNLAAVTFSISTPYLRDARQADQLLALAVEYSCRVANADIEFEPFAKTGVDTSNRANQLRKDNQPIPRLSLEQLGESTRNCLVCQAERLNVTDQPDRWRQFLSVPVPNAPEIRARNRSVPPSVTIKHAELASFSLATAVPPDTKSIRWYCLRSTADSYNLSVEEFEFAERASRWIYREPALLSDESVLQGSSLLGAFDPKTGYGVAEVFAQIETTAGVFVSKAVRLISVADDASPFQEAISSEFNLPYLFFGSSLARLGATGPELKLGADCANFIIYGLRQCGWQIPWSDAKHLIPRLNLLARVDLDQSVTNPEQLTPVQTDDLKSGIVIIFDNHVAAVWRTERPGWLGLNDLVVHQLEGRPEIVPLAKLTKARRRFSVLSVPRPEQAIRVVLGGDVMLGRTIKKRILAGSDVLRPCSEANHRADLAFANLECSLCAPNLAPESKPYCFQAPLEAAPLIAKAGFSGMLVANNHTGDFGPRGFKQTISGLHKAGITPIGGGSNLTTACAPARFERKRVRVAVFGCADPSFCSPIASASESGICPWDSDILQQNISEASGAGQFCIVLCHWDAEAGRALCRKRAADWIDAGASIVIGSGPHHLLDHESVHGHPVFYSVGNLLFDGGGPDRDWSRGAMVELTIAFPDSLVRAQIIDPLRQVSRAGEQSPTSNQKTISSKQ
ncbi:MAG: CapA family protein [Verrucomicrobia bacterium]|nr:CapA family protein [Verrucomicrobiota bacterium]